MPTLKTHVECPSCGGYGGEPGEHFGDRGWHPCYRCGASGVIPIAEAYDEYVAATHAYATGQTALVASLRTEIATLKVEVLKLRGIAPEVPASSEEIPF
jgi:hypothetical protein